MVTRVPLEVRVGFGRGGFEEEAGGVVGRKGVGRIRNYISQNVHKR